MIRVDTREGSSALVSPLRKLGLPVEETTLVAGDVEFAGNGPDGSVIVGVEHKQWTDALKGMRDGRLAEQIRRMKKVQHVQWLLLVGRIRQGQYTVEVKKPDSPRWFPVPGRYTMQEIEAKLLTLHASGVGVWRTETPSEAVRWLRSLYLWWERSWGDHTSLHTYQTPSPALITPLEEPTYTQKMAHVLPGLGPARSKAVTGVFGSPREMVNADSSTWQTIPGIGKGLAERMVAVCTGELQR